jgi:hypothetical protein
MILAREQLVKRVELPSADGFECSTLPRWHFDAEDI